MSEDRLNCYIVQDLMPTYIDHLTNEKTSNAVKSHLENCKECREVFETMKCNIAVDNQMELKKVKDVFGKTKRMYLMKGILSALIILPILTSFIVNLAVDHNLTWFYIVAGSIVFAGVLSGLLILKKKNKLIWVMAGLSVMILPFLFLLEKVINRYFADNPSPWFDQYAFPITMIWLVIMWIGVILFKAIKINYAFCLGIFFVISFAGSVLTNRLVNETATGNIFVDDWIDLLCCGVLAAVSFIIGILLEVKKNK